MSDTRAMKANGPLAWTTAALLPALVVRAGAGAAVTTLQALRQLSQTELAAAPSVCVTATVTLARQPQKLLVVQDASGAAAVHPRELDDLTPFPQLGERLILRGVAAAGRLSPAIAGGSQGLQVERLGRAELPPPLPLSPRDLVGGRYEHQRVEVEAIVRASRADRELSRIELGTGIGRVTLLAPPAPDANGLNARLPEGARVRARGVLSSIVNRRGEWVGCLLHAAAWEDISLIAPPPAPEGLPLARLDEIARWGTAGSDSPPIRVRGVVLAVEWGHRAFLRDETGAAVLYLGRATMDRVAPGDHVEAAGYPILLDKRWVLQDATLRRLAGGLPPTPVNLDSRHEDPALFDTDLVRLSGQVIGVSEHSSGLWLLMQTRHGVAEVALPHAPEGAPTPGAWVEAVGIAEVFARMTAEGHTETLGLRVHALPPGGVRVLRPAPWWTPRRLAAVIAVVSGGMIWLGGWVLVLQRIVRRQGARLRESVRQEAVWQERTRIARDIHDDVGAVLTQIALMSDMCRDEQDPAARTDAVARIGEASRRAIEALDQIVWTVNPSNDRVDRTVSYCCRIVQGLLEGLPVRCRLDVPPDLPARPIAAAARHHLAMAVKEAARNALRHAGAQEIRLAARCAEAMLTIEISDDGRGLVTDAVPAGRSGIRNIQQRLIEIGGRASFESRPGGGTSVVLQVRLGAVSPQTAGWRSRAADEKLKE
ncbi:MAG: histidine kinase [Kiritimatiellae bacterium]|nr:histidine kinase [Kiritimatiellia bacterium]